MILLLVIYSNIRLANVLGIDNLDRIKEEEDAKREY